MYKCKTLCAFIGICLLKINIMFLHNWFPPFTHIWILNLNRCTQFEEYPYISCAFLSLQCPLMKS
jgi:hypothetical protein